MPERIGQPLRSVLSRHRPAWGQWLKWVDATVRRDFIPHGGEAADLVRVFLKLASDDSPARQIARVCAAFGIDEADTTSANTGQGWLKVIAAEGTLFAQVDSLAIAAGSGSASRRRSVLAHEIGHLFYACLAERALSGGVALPDLRSRSREAERFCWEFALELTCPRKQRQLWTPGSVKCLLTSGELSRLKQSGLGGDQLTYLHLRRLAAGHRISTRLVIVALDRHPLLDEFETGIAVFREHANQWTGRERFLRLWQYARPSWGHVISNKRAHKQGFAAAQGIYDDVVDQETVVAEEQLELWRTQEGEKKKWKRTKVRTSCAYTPVDVKGEGRYLVGIWRWPR